LPCSFDKARIQTSTDLMHLHTRAVRMLEMANSPLEDSKQVERSPGSESDVLVDANVGAGKCDSSSKSPKGTPPTRTGSQSKLTGQDKRKAPRTTGQKASTRVAAASEGTLSTPKPSGPTRAEVQDENVNYSA
jgi:hypothetical protein